MLSASTLPAKIIFVSSGAGSIQKLTQRDSAPPNFFYGSSKAALNYLAVHYARAHPEWRVNAVCPGYRATKINDAELNDDTRPELGAVRVVELCREGKGGVTGTYSNSEGELPW